MDQELNADTPVGARVEYATKVRNAEGRRVNAIRRGTYTGEHFTRGVTGGGRRTYYGVRLDDGSTTQVASAVVLETPPAPMTEGDRAADRENVLTVDTQPVPQVAETPEEAGEPAPMFVDPALRRILDALPGATAPARPERKAEAQEMAEVALQDLASGFRALDRVDLVMPGVLEPGQLDQLRGVLGAVYPRLHRLLAE